MAAHREALSAAKGQAPALIVIVQRPFGFIRDFVGASYYLDRPEEFTVISPKTAGKSPQIRQLVDYLASVLGGQRIFLYAARSETYREIDLQTLVFKTTETVTPHPGLKWLVKGASAGEPASENLRLAHT